MGPLKRVCLSSFYSIFSNFGKEDVSKERRKRRNLGFG
jgi:hypothetical protein